LILAVFQQSKMSYNGDVTPVYANPADAEASATASATSASATAPAPAPAPAPTGNGPKHGFGLASGAAPEIGSVQPVLNGGAEAPNVITQPSPTIAAAKEPPAAVAPVALAAVLAVNQAALDGRPLVGEVADGPGTAGSSPALPKPKISVAKAAKKSKVVKAKQKAKPKLPMRANAPGRSPPTPSLPSAAEAVSIIPNEGNKKADVMADAEVGAPAPVDNQALTDDDDALAAKIAADTIAVSDAARRKSEERQQKQDKLDMAKRIAAQRVAAMKAKADAKAKEMVDAAVQAAVKAAASPAAAAASAKSAGAVTKGTKKKVTKATKKNAGSRKKKKKKKTPAKAGAKTPVKVQQKAPSVSTDPSNTMIQHKAPPASSDPSNTKIQQKAPPASSDHSNTEKASPSATAVVIAAVPTAAKNDVSPTIVIPSTDPTNTKIQQKAPPASFDLSNTKEASPSATAVVVAAAPTAAEDPVSPTTAIPPLDVAHPSPGTPLPPLPPVPQPMELDIAEEKKQEAEEDDPVLDHAIATANTASVATNGINIVGAKQAAGQSNQELTPAAALAVASAAASAAELHGDNRMTDFHSAVGGERINPPAKEAPKKRGLPKTTGLSDSEDVIPSSAAKKTKPVPKKKGPGRPRKKKARSPAAAAAAQTRDEINAPPANANDGAQSNQNKTKNPRKTKVTQPPRNGPARNRKQPGLYSDDRPGTVTFEEQFGDGNDKGGKKEMVKCPDTGEYVMKKFTAMEALAAEELFNNDHAGVDTGGFNDVEVDEQDPVDEEDDCPVEPSGCKASAAVLTAPAKSKDNKKRSVSRSEPSADDNKYNTDAEPPKKRGRGRPPKKQGTGTKKTAEEAGTAKKAAAKVVRQADDTDTVGGAESANRGRGGRTRGGERSSLAAAREAARGKAAAKSARATANNEAGTSSGDEDSANVEKAHNLFMSREGKNAYFRVELLIGPPGNRVKMAPFSEVLCEDGNLSIDSYVATEGQPFALRVKIARPRSDNAVYGGRVYIDKPCNCKHHDTNEKLGERHVCGIQNDVVKQLNHGMDHFFWIGPGETEYMIEGFYKNQATSQQFVFAKPAQKLDLAVGVEDDEDLQNERLMNIWRSIGGIRISFSLLDSWKKRAINKTFKPKQAAIDAEAHIERKGKELSAQPGDVVIDNVPKIEREAVLSDDIVFEKRIDYNTFCGYKASHAMMKYTNTKGLYKGLPIDILKQDDVQRQCINMYMTQVPLEQMQNKFHDGLEDAFNKTHSEAGQSSSEGAAASGQTSGKPSKWVRVTDIVDAICDDLSPAGSHLICTGEYHVDQETEIRNYGETIVQNTEATKEEKKADYEHKVKRLTHFFTNSPHVYDFQDYTEEETGKIRFEVCKAVVDLTGNSDDEFA